MFLGGLSPFARFILGRPESPISAMKSTEEEKEDNTKLSEKEKDKEIQGPNIKFIRNNTSAEVTKCINKSVASFTGDIVSTQFPNHIKISLEKDFGVGWNVFSGKHFSGTCRFIEGHFAEFEVGGCIVVVFKSYVPSNN